MYPSEWAGQKVEVQAHGQRLVWVEDPYQLVLPEEIDKLRYRLSLASREVVVAGDAFTLRRLLNDRDPNTARLVVIDQSYTPRQPHLLPQDTEPKDLVPIKAPDWKPLVHPEARLRPTIRDFLIYVTDDESWPAKVNIFPYEELARTDPEGFVGAFESFRQSGRSLTSEDLLLVGASAALGIDLLDLADPILALQLAFHSGDKWTKLSQYFNRSEIEQIRATLQKQSGPVGELFGDHPDRARLALVSLIVLSQHAESPGLEQPGRQLPLLDGSLAPYIDCPATAVIDPPSWFVEDEVPRFEKVVQPSFLKYLSATLQLNDPESAKRFAVRERLSSKLRSQVAYEISQPARKPGAEGAIGFSIDTLLPDFKTQKRALEELIRIARTEIDRLKLTPPRDVKLERFSTIYDKKGLYRLDGLVGVIRGLIRDIEGPAKRQWQNLPGFAERWARDLQECRDLLSQAGRLRDDLDFEFGKFLETRWPEIIHDQVLTAGRFYRDFMAPRRRTVDGKMQKALVLVIDSMRLDIWRELIRPALEREYEVVEQLGFAELPSETVVSRSCFFAGERPGGLPGSRKETDFFANLIQRCHGMPTSFEDSESLRPGMRYLVRAKDGLTFAGVFDFSDKLSHNMDLDRNMMDQVFRPFVREILALLQELGPDTLVFMTADHGHYRREGGSPVYLEGSDVGYRSAYVPGRVEGEKAKHVFQIPAKTLGHASPGFFVFPKPGFHLRSREMHTTPGKADASYRHGGISIAEVVVPLVFLRHKAAPTKLRLSVNLREVVVAGGVSHIQVSLTADGKVDSPIRVYADTLDVEPVLANGASTVPVSIVLRYTPTSPGKRQMRIHAALGEEPDTTALLDVDVAPAPVTEDAATIKLRKLWGDD